MSFISSLLFSCLFFLSCNSDKKLDWIASSAKVESQINHNDWDALLKKHVDNSGNVNYKGFKTDVLLLEAYIKKLTTNPIANETSKSEKLACFINLYNAATIKLIIDNYPVKSIKDINKPWDSAWIAFGDKKISLGDIEHKILRKMNEPRIHFAINCASYSCPKLKNEAYTAANLETQLEQAIIDFVTDPKRNIISAKKVELSKIFKWFKKDFTQNKTLIAYINTYTSEELTSKTKIDYLDYNWSLNEKQ